MASRRRLTPRYPTTASALSPGADPCPSGRQPRPLYTRPLGRQGNLPAPSDPRAAVRAAEGVRQALRRQDDCAGARSRPWLHQGGPAVGLFKGQSTLGGIDSPGVAYLYGPTAKPSSRCGIFRARWDLAGRRVWTPRKMQAISHFGTGMWSGADVCPVS